MLNGEFIRIDKNRTILSRFNKENDDGFEIKTYTGELYQTTIHGEKVYFLLPNTDFGSVAEFYTGAAIPHYMKGKKKTLMACKEIIQRHWKQYLQQASDYFLNSLNNTIFDADYFTKLIKQKHSSYEWAIQRHEYVIAGWIDKDIDAIKEFMKNEGMEAKTQNIYEGKKVRAILPSGHIETFIVNKDLGDCVQIKEKTNSNKIIKYNLDKTQIIEIIEGVKEND